MNVRYIEFSGKHAKGTKDERVYLDKPKDEWQNYGCSYENGYMKLDIDDYDHKTAELVEPIKGTARSEAIIKLLDSLNIKYNAIKTPHGVHIFFRRPGNITPNNKLNWYSVIGIKCEWKFPEKDDHIPLKTNGTERPFIKGSIDNTEIDELPFFLYPLQKGKQTQEFDIDFKAGDRTNKLCSYLFSLVIKKDFSTDQAFKIIRYTNDYVFDEPIPEDTLNAEILNKSTIDKLKEKETEKSQNKLDHVTIGDEIINNYTLITVNGELYHYSDGIYKPFGQDKINAYICNNYPYSKTNLKREIISYIQGKSYRDEPKQTYEINVKNGILCIDETSVKLLPHTPEKIFFKQFNAVYNPSAKSKLLENSLQKWFKNDENIELFKQLLGYLMMNHADYDKMFFFIGKPKTGKSTVLSLVTNFCGKDNISSIGLDSISDKFGLEGIINKTANISNETPKGKILKTDKIKMLSDGSRIPISRKFKSEIYYQFTGKLIFAMNSFPDMSKDFDGIERRLIIFPFKRKFKTDDPDFDPHIEYTLSDDESMSVMLNMAIDGYKSLIKNKGFTATKDSNAALNEFVCENDSILQWLTEQEITEEYLLNEPVSLGHNGLYRDYTAFCINVEKEPETQKKFTSYIKNKYNFDSKIKELKSDQLTKYGYSKGKRIKYTIFQEKK